MRSFIEIDGLLILAAALVAATCYSLLRNYLARAAREQAQRLQEAQIPVSTAHEHRRAA